MRSIYKVHKRYKRCDGAEVIRSAPLSWDTSMYGGQTADREHYALLYQDLPLPLEMS